MSEKDKPKNSTDVAKVDETKSTGEEQASGPELIHFDVTLTNGNEVTLSALKNMEDWDLELLEHAQLGNTAVFLFGVLTWASRFKLRAAGAKTPDFETISIAYGEATGNVTPE